MRRRTCFPSIARSAAASRCGTDDEVVRRCTGGLICPAQMVERLIHFCSRRAFDIEGMGEKTMQEFYEAGWLHDRRRIFSACPRMRRRLPSARAGGRSRRPSFRAAIAARRTIALARFIYALGIRRIGENNAKLLARHYGSYANWRASMLAATEIGSDARLELGSISASARRSRPNSRRFLPRRIILRRWMRWSAS